MSKKCNPSSVNGQCLHTHINTESETQHLPKVNFNRLILTKQHFLICYGLTTQRNMTTSEALVFPATM